MEIVNLTPLNGDHYSNYAHIILIFTINFRSAIIIGPHRRWFGIYKHIYRGDIVCGCRGGNIILSTRGLPKIERVIKYRLIVESRLLLSSVGVFRANTAVPSPPHLFYSRDDDCRLYKVWWASWGETFFARSPESSPRAECERHLSGNGSSLWFTPPWWS